MATSIAQPLPGALRALENAGVAYELHHHPAARRADELHLTGLDINSSAKTLAFRLPDDRIALAAIPGFRRLRYQLLAAAVGTSRSSLRPASADDLTRLGMEPGGVAPFTPADGVVVVIDSSLLTLGVVHCGSGSPRMSVSLSPAALRTAMPAARFIDLCGNETLAQ